MLSNYNVITLFPKIFDEWLRTGVISKGLEDGLFKFNSINLRNYGLGEYKQVDDAPYGGGPGMVLMVEPLDNAITENKSEIFSNSKTFLGLAYAIVPIFYGYMFAAITKAAFTKTINNNDNSNTFYIR